MPSARLLVFRLITALLVMGWQYTVAHANTQDESLVQDTVQKGYAILNDETLDRELRAEQFHMLLSGIMDSKRLAIFTLGPFARSATAAQVDEFSEAFADFVACLIQHKLAGNPGESIIVTGSIVRAPDDVIVTAKLTGSSRSNGQPINMGFRIRKAPNGRDAIVDLQVEGVSMALAQRSDFTSWLQQHNGDIAALAGELRARTRQLRDEDAGVAAAAGPQAR